VTIHFVVNCEMMWLKQDVTFSSKINLPD